MVGNPKKHELSREVGCQCDPTALQNASRAKSAHVYCHQESHATDLSNAPERETRRPPHQDRLMNRVPDAKWSLFFGPKCLGTKFDQKTQFTPAEHEQLRSKVE